MESAHFTLELGEPLDKKEPLAPEQPLYHRVYCVCLVTMQMLVIQKTKSLRNHIPFPLAIIAAFTIHLLFFFVVLTDLVVWLYQEIYFSILEIPKIKRAQYVKMTRQQLPNLSLVQKWSCAYCEYTNGVFTWAKAIANQTEIYSCAIKYTHRYPGQGYQKDFYEQDRFTKPA